ncbi:MAG: TIGR03000 domain-containing protein [Planctomycetes bacterium]|nr:TIGR03000 domain-containing protein [Planctomycetota bacterium]
MNRMLLYGVALFLSVVGISVTGGPEQARAGHAYRGCYGCACYGCWGCDGCHQIYGCHGCWGCHGCDGAVVVSPCYGCQGCHSCNGSYGWHGCAGAMAVEVAPTVPRTNATLPPSQPIPSPAADKGIDATPAPDDSALLQVRLPADAKLIVNDRLTRSTGALRRYRSRGLEPGVSYSYELRAEFTRDGRTISETKIVSLRANETAEVDFAFDAAQVAQASR